MIIFTYQLLLDIQTTLQRSSIIVCICHVIKFLRTPRKINNTVTDNFIDFRMGNINYWKLYWSIPTNSQSSVRTIIYFSWFDNKCLCTRGMCRTAYTCILTTLSTTFLNRSSCIRSAGEQYAFTTIIIALHPYHK